MRIGPITLAPPSWWAYVWRCKGECYGIFRNKEGVKPGRWGFFVLGFEFGSRNPGNWFGVFLKRIGFWPW